MNPSSRPMEDHRALVDWPAVAMQSLAFSAAVFLRKRFGERFIGLQAALAPLLMLIWTALWPRCDPQPMVVFIVLYLLMCGVARLDVDRRRKRGDAVHTRYNGESRLQRLLPRWDEVKVKKIAEPAFVLAVAMFLWAASPPLGSYLALAAMAMGFNIALIERRDRLRLLDLSDAAAEQRELGERFHRR